MPRPTKLDLSHLLVESPEDAPTVHDPGLARRLGDPDACATPTSGPYRPRADRLRWHLEAEPGEVHEQAPRVPDPPTSDTLGSSHALDAFEETGHRWIAQVELPRREAARRRRREQLFIAGAALACVASLLAVGWLLAF